MPTKPFFIVSDVHLGAVPASTERAFRRFLSHAEETASGLLLNGDLFDFWFEYRTVMPRGHYRVLARLADLIEAGVPVWFVGGNHDAWGGSFLRDEVGIQLLEGPVRLEIAGRQALVTHGDGLNPDDRGYRVLRWVLRNRATIAAFRQIHPDIGSRIARYVSSTEGKVGHHQPAMHRSALLVQHWAAEQLRADPSLDLVVAGHVHLPTVLEVEPGRYYANAGDWLNHCTYLEVPAEPGPPRVRGWRV